MPIFVPGKRTRKGKAQPSKRSVVAPLSLTAMVDMFTVLAVFLLQNYAMTGQVLEYTDKVKLPDAASVKKLQPANVLTLSLEGIFFNKDKVAEFEFVKTQEDWMIQDLADEVKKFIEQGEVEKQAIGKQIKEAVAEAKAGGDLESEIDEFRRVTIQADKEIDFLTLKKVMFTLTEAGIAEINFAVIKSGPDDDSDS